MALQISGTSVVDNNRKGIFNSANVGAFANPSRPTGAAVGDLIYSTTDGELQVWNGIAWVSAGGAITVSASGGTYVNSSPDGRQKTHLFESSGTFTLPSPAYLEVYVVGGAGYPGANAPQGTGGRGGAGGMVYKSGLWSAGSYPITVGSSSNVFNGTGSFSGMPCPPSVFGPGSIIASGGGGGGSSTTADNAFGGSGGCGGGGGAAPPAMTYPKAGGTGNQGFPGGNGGVIASPPPIANRRGGGGGSGGVTSAGSPGASQTTAIGASGGATFIYGQFPAPLQSTPSSGYILVSGFWNAPSPQPAPTNKIRYGGAFLNPVVPSQNGCVVINYTVNQST